MFVELPIKLQLLINTSRPILVWIYVGGKSPRFRLSLDICVYEFKQNLIPFPILPRAIFSKGLVIANGYSMRNPTTLIILRLESRLVFYITSHLSLYISSPFLNTIPGSERCLGSCRSYIISMKVDDLWIFRQNEWTVAS